MASCQSDNQYGQSQPVGIENGEDYSLPMNMLDVETYTNMLDVETYTNKQLPQQHIALKAVQDVLADLEMNSSHC